jgi:RNA polymerase sigma-70 factor (ECF subfamily)
MPSEAPAQRLEELIARCAAGDSAALQLLYQNTAAQLFGVLKRILLRADLAEEALQDVYVSIWRNAKDYRPRKGPCSRG